MIDWINSVSPAWLEYFVLMNIQNTIFLGLLLFALFKFGNKQVRILKAIALIGLFKLFIPPIIIISDFYAFFPGFLTIILGEEVIVSADGLSEPLLSPASILCIFWLLSSCSIIVFTLVRMIKLRLKLETAVPISKKINHKLKVSDHLNLFLSQKVNSPYIFGFFRYRVVLPRNWDNWSMDLKRTVISHEWAHIRERDHWINLFKLVAFALHFYNPLVWLLINRLNYYSELLCDDMAIDSNKIAPQEYNKRLLKIAEDTKYGWACEPALQFSKAHKLIKNRMTYQLTKRKGIFMKTLTLKSKLIIVLFGLVTLLFSLRCSGDESTVTNEEITTTEQLNEAISNNTGILNYGEVEQKPVLIGKSKPEYPEAARKAGIEGTVVVTVIINEEGKVDHTEVFKSILGLDEAASEAAKKLKFEPARHSGNPVKVAMNIPFSFRLK